MAAAGPGFHPWRDEMNHGLKIRRRVNESVVARWPGQEVTVTLVGASRERAEFEITLAPFLQTAKVTVQQRHGRVDLTIKAPECVKLLRDELLAEAPTH